MTIAGPLNSTPLALVWSLTKAWNVSYLKPVPVRSESELLNITPERFRAPLEMHFERAVIPNEERDLARIESLPKVVSTVSNVEP
jgi:hypothetical protein